MSGDSLDDNLWEGANEYDLVKKVKSDDEYESGDEAVGLTNDEGVAIDAKSEKRKRKLSILKELKRAKSKPSSGVDSSNDPADSNSHVSSEHVFQLSSSEMAAEVRKLIQAFRKGSRHDDDDNDAAKNNIGLGFTPECFFSPPVADGSSSSGSGTSSGATSKAVCPFVRSLTAGLPSYKKALRVTDTADDHRGSPVVVIVCASAVRYECMYVCM